MDWSLAIAALTLLGVGAISGRLSGTHRRRSCSSSSGCWSGRRCSARSISAFVGGMVFRAALKRDPADVNELEPRSAPLDQVPQTAFARPGEQMRREGRVEVTAGSSVRFQRCVHVVAERQRQLGRSGNHTGQPDGRSHRDQGPDDLVEVGPRSQCPLGVRLMGAGRRVYCQRRRQPRQGMRFGVQPWKPRRCRAPSRAPVDEALVVERKPAQGLLVPRPCPPSRFSVALRGSCPRAPWVGTKGGAPSSPRWHEEPFARHPGGEA